jgi:hypothetical protein
MMLTLSRRSGATSSASFAASPSFIGPSISFFLGGDVAEQRPSRDARSGGDLFGGDGVVPAFGEEPEGRSADVGQYLCALPVPQRRSIRGHVLLLGLSESYRLRR